MTGSAEERLIKLEDGTVDVLPDARARDSKNAIMHAGVSYVRMHCISCGRRAPWIVREDARHVSYLCEGPNSCSAKFGGIANTCAVPDEIYAEKVRQAQVERVGRPLNAREMIVQLDDPNSYLSLLAREAPKLR